MSDYRIGLSIEHGEDRSYVVHLGQRYEIREFDMRRQEWPGYLLQDLEHFKIPHKWDLYLGLAEVSEEPVKAPESPPKRRLSDLGLRVMPTDVIVAALTDYLIGSTHIDTGDMAAELLDALRDSGYTVIMSVEGAARARTAPSFDPAWDKSPEEIRRIQALPNHSRLPSKPGFERDYTAYHAADTVYPHGRQV